MNEPTTSTEPKLLTTAQVSEMTGKSVLALQMMRHNKKGPKFQRIGRSVRYLESDVLAWLDNRTTPKQSEPTIVIKPKRKSKKKIISALNLSKPQLGRLNKLIATADNERDIKISTLIAARLISVRLGNVLNSLDIKTIDDLGNTNSAKIAAARNCGKMTEREAIKLHELFVNHTRNDVWAIDGILEPVEALVTMVTSDGIITGEPEPKTQDKLADPANLEVTIAGEQVEVIPAPVIRDIPSQEDGNQEDNLAPFPPDYDAFTSDHIESKTEEKKSNMGLFALIKAYIRSRLPRRIAFGERYGIDVNEIVAIGTIVKEDYENQHKFSVLYYSGYSRSYWTDETFNKSKLTSFREEIIKEWLK